MKKSPIIIAITALILLAFAAPWLWIDNGEDIKESPFFKPRFADRFYQPKADCDCDGSCLAVSWVPFGAKVDACSEDYYIVTFWGQHIYKNNPSYVAPQKVGLGESCTTYTDCDMPMEYLVQSNCPFGVACVEGSCQVICPLYVHDKNSEVSKSYPVSCQEDIDCNCAERGDRTKACMCVNGGCVSVETP
ncbi:MAG: hypothetical protein KBD15_03505 [Candidatus Magasanikbacteria bacterium]|nr:hypothetical protein [Candidatus Magasanikbacteria bacterium]